MRIKRKMISWFDEVIVINIVVNLKMIVLFT